MGQAKNSRGRNSGNSGCKLLAGDYVIRSKVSVAATILTMERGSSKSRRSTVAELAWRRR